MSKNTSPFSKFMKKFLFLMLACAYLSIFGCSGDSDMVTPSSSQSGVVYGNLVYYGGEVYETVVIGSQTWFKRNLNYNPGEGNSACYYCDEYGRLYDWSTAMALPSSCNSASCPISSPHRGICPSGWHIPSNEDWEILMEAVGGSSTAGTHLKATSGWNDYNGKSGNGLDTYGFSALPGGYGDGGYIFNAGYDGYWWSASEYSSNNAYNRFMYYDIELAYWYYNIKSLLFSVRCVQD